MDTPTSEHRTDHRPLIIGGMHRSGTSLTASLVASAGVNLGAQLLGALPGNDFGHFEDIEMLDFHQLALRTLGLGTEGYTPRPVGPIPASLEQPARRMIADRRRTGGPWGWKEPRTTLFLDFWQQLLPDAGYLFVFRRPDEVLDSLLRRGDTAFAHNPRLGLLVWLNYNRIIRDFIRARPDSCVLLEIGQVIADPRGAMERIRTRLGIDVRDPEPLFRSDHFRAVDDASRAEVARALVPEVWDVYADLCRLADMQAAAAAAPVIPVVDCAALQWGRAARAENDVAALRREVAGVRAESATLQGRVAETEAESRRLADERSRLEHDQRLVVETAERLTAEHASLAEALATTGAERDRLAVALCAAEESATAAAARLALLEDARQELTVRITAAATEQRRLEGELSAARDHVERLEADVRHEQERRDMLAARLTETQEELAVQRERTLGARLRRWLSPIRRWFDRQMVGARGQARSTTNEDDDTASRKDAA